jgi:hypothetical protein
MANSMEARNFNKVMRKTHKKGILEIIYERHDHAMKKIEAAGIKLQREPVFDVSTIRQRRNVSIETTK